MKKEQCFLCNLLTNTKYQTLNKYYEKNLSKSNRVAAKQSNSH